MLNKMLDPIKNYQWAKPLFKEIINIFLMAVLLAEHILWVPKIVLVMAMYHRELFLILSQSHKI